jgi:sigma-B regulation protein RsbU (phosphoserine phosphatase)
MLISEKDEQLQSFQDNLDIARTIQLAMLPKERHFKRLFKDYFTVYLPHQGTISGDFYWVGKNENLQYIVAGDCTGHGVSASLLSVLALNLFEYVIMNKGIKKTNEILREVDKKFIESFNNHNMDTYDNPWIDISLVCIDHEKKKIYFSSANRKLLLVKSTGVFHIYKGSNYPIGGWQIETNRKFESQCIPYEKNDIIYLGSDGFQDQFGGPKDEKYKSRRLHEFLVKNSQLPFKQQQLFLEKEFDYWKNGRPQTDDVCIVAVKL